ncbi:hypothetical protein [Maribacter sp. R77961]
MRNFISNSIKVMLETLGVSLKPELKRRYVLVPVERTNGFKR